MMHPIPGDERSRHEASESSFCSACPFCRGFFSRSWEFLSTCWLSLFLKNTHTNSYDIWKKHNGNNVRRNEVQQILWDIFELTFESVRNLGWISLVSPGIRASVYPHRQGTTCTPATPATHQASDVRWMTPWRYYRERNYKRKHIGITEDILISQQKLWSNFLWDTSLKLRYHTYGIAWRDDTYLLSNRMFHFQPGRHSTKTAARRPMRHFGRKMSKVYFFVHTRQDRGCEKPRRQHLSPSRPGIRLLAKKTCKTLGPKTPSAKHSMGIADFSMSLEHQSVELGSALWQPSNVEIPFKRVTRSYRSKKIHPRWEKKHVPWQNVAKNRA